MLAALAANAAQGLGQGIGAALGGPNTSGAPVSNFLDGSGWTVSTGGSRANGSQRSDSALGAAVFDPAALMWVGAAVLAFFVVRKLRNK